MKPVMVADPARRFTVVDSRKPDDEPPGAA
jgi:hypothetical protein